MQSSVVQSSAEPVEMPFGQQTFVGLGNPVLEWGPDPAREQGTFERTGHVLTVAAMRPFADLLWTLAI